MFGNAKASINGLIEEAYTMEQKTRQKIETLVYVPIPKQDNQILVSESAEAGGSGGPWWV